ncbi:hypothetical protein BY996DRAFT_4583080 [Phakopsora pachyrhizi]|nr:hypothetical protein BY996DRAFT_4583080 [Phakopsora pachyrhizi]
MVLGRVTHYAFDLALVSTVLAGVKRNTGYSLKTDSLPEGVPQSLISTYLVVGENIFDFLSAYSHTSTSFQRVPANSSSSKGNWIWGSGKDGSK